MTAPAWFAPTPYPYRANSLNLFRLVLAAMVLFAHSWYIAGRGHGPIVQGENLGGWAVAGFFVISGFLITRSRLRADAGEYLLHRIARIYPAFLGVLLVTVTVFAPIAMVLQHGSLAGYLTSAPTPLEYVWGNLLLEVRQYGIGVSLSEVPYPEAWNGSLWTLYYEFLCYLIIWAVGFLPLFRRSPIPVAILFGLSVLAYAQLERARELGLDERFELLAKLLPFFLGGSLIYFVVERWGLSRVVGVAALGLACVLIWLIPGWGGQLAAPLLALGLLALSTFVPQPRWVARNDVSYGFYIYAWPVQQLVLMIGGLEYGMAVYLALTGLITFGLAWLSWLFIERPIMVRVRQRSPAQQKGEAHGQGVR